LCAVVPPRRCGWCGGSCRAGSSLNASLNQSRGGVALRRAEAGGGLRGYGGQAKATEGRHVASEDTFLTLGMQRWRIGMRVRNVRTPGEGGAGGGQNSVGESLLRAQSAAGPNVPGARCPSAADQSSVFNRHNVLVDW